MGDTFGAIATPKPGHWSGAIWVPDEDPAAATDSEAGPSLPSMQVYGHSIPNDAGATASRYGFVSRLALSLGCPAASVTKIALSGGRVADQSSAGGVASLLNGQLARDLVAGPYITRGGLKLACIGGNDSVYAPSGANGNALVEAALRLAYSSMLSARVIPALANGSTLNTAGGLVFSSGWTPLADTTQCLAPGEAYHATNGAWVEMPPLDAAYNGEAITVILPLSSATRFIATASISGVDKASIDTTGMQAALAAAGGAVSGGAPVALRIPAGVASAGQTPRITFSGMTGGKLCGISGFDIEGHDPLPLALPTIPLHPNDSAQNSNAAYQKARVAAVAPEFSSAKIIDVDNILPDEASWSQSVTGHPNNLGYAQYAAALYPAIRSLLTPAVVARMN